MKYINFKRYKFSTSLKALRELIYNFLKFFEVTNFKRYDFKKVYKYLDIRKFSFIKVIKNLNPISWRTHTVLSPSKTSSYSNKSFFEL